MVSLFVDSCRQLQLGKQAAIPFARCEVKVGLFLIFFNFAFCNIFNFSNSQMGKADSLRSSKKPVASEGLSMFVVN